MANKIYNDTDIKNIADAIREKAGTTDTYKVSEMASAIESIPTGGGGSGFTGHADIDGLKAIGWDNEDIAYFQEHGVFWNEEDDDIYKLTDDEKNTNISTPATRYLPKRYNTSSLNYYYALIGVPKLNWTSKTILSKTFNRCGLSYVPMYEVGNITNVTEMFYQSKMQQIPLLDLTNCTSLASFCMGADQLKKLPNLNTSNITNFGGHSFSYGAFYGCMKLNYVPLLDCGKVTNFGMYAFQSCYSLTHLEGFKDLGKSYETSRAANYVGCTVSFSGSTLLTHDSLMNVINNLYDIGSIEVQTQQLVLGSTNLAKLTADEIAIATNKGWSVS